MHLCVACPASSPSSRGARLLSSCRCGQVPQRVFPASESRRPSSPTIKAAVRCGQGVTVGTQERQILNAIVSPVAIDVLHFDRHFARKRMALRSAAPRAPLSEPRNEIFLYEAIAIIDAAIIAALQKLAAPIEFGLSMASLGTIRLLCERYNCSADSAGFPFFVFSETGIGAAQRAVFCYSKARENCIPTPGGTVAAK